MTTIDRIRAGWRPTMADKIAACSCLGELSGLYKQMRADGRMTDEIEALCKERAEQIRSEK